MENLRPISVALVDRQKEVFQMTNMSSMYYLQADIVSTLLVIFPKKHIFLLTYMKCKEELLSCVTLGCINCLPVVGLCICNFVLMYKSMLTL